MGRIESALEHHFYQIREAELVAQGPTYTQDDHLGIEVPASKQLLKARAACSPGRRGLPKERCTR